MTDKVQKIRNEVERLQNELIQEKEKGFGSDVDDACILELQNVLTYIDSQQEEPTPKIFEDILNAKTAAESLGISQEEHDKIVDKLIYGKEPELVDVDDLPNKEKEPVSRDYREIYKNIAQSDAFKSAYENKSLGEVMSVEGEEPVSDECIYNRTLEERQRSCKFCSAAC